MTLQNITLLGGGVLGSQIAYQSAYCGKNVKIWLRSEASVERARAKVDQVYKLYIHELQTFKETSKNPIAAKFFPKGFHPHPETLDENAIEDLIQQAHKAYESIVYVTDLPKAVADADLIIEALAEDPKQKTEMYKKLAGLMEEKTILVTNSSTLMPSIFAEVTGRPEKYFALHFANSIWKCNLAEIMGHSTTNEKYIEEVKQFAIEINMVPSLLKKEQPGYILNSLLVPFLDAAQKLIALDVAEPEDIDNSWRIGTGSPLGPCQILDIVGLETAYNIVSMKPDANDPDSVTFKILSVLKSYIEQGKTGVMAGEGFYKYN